MLKSSEPSTQVAAVYVRVSTVDQKEQGYSPQNQLEAAYQLAKARGWNIPDSLIFNENASASRIEGIDYNKDISDGISKRPELNRLLKKATEKPFKHLIVLSRDRLSRVAEETLALYTYFAKYGIEICYSKLGEEINNENETIARFMHLMMLNIAEYESTMISTRVKDGNKSCIQRGYWAGGSAPFGYFRKVDKATPKKNTKLFSSDFESHLVKTIFDLYLNGHGYKCIADIMNNQHGYITWSKSKIEAIIKNQTYTGQIAWDRRGGKRNPVKHDKIITSSYDKNIEIIPSNNWDIVTKYRNERNENRDPYLHRTTYILKNKLYCSHCEGIMKPINPGNNKTPVYVCKTCKGKAEKKVSYRIPCWELEANLLGYLNNEINIKNTETSRLYNQYLNNLNKINECNTKFIVQLDAKIALANDKVSEINKLIEKKQGSALATSLEKHRTLYTRIVSEYESTKKLYDSKQSTIVLSKDEFLSKFNDWKNSLFDSNKNQDELKILRRKFITTFIDRIYVMKERQSGNIIIDKIIFF